MHNIILLGNPNTGKTTIFNLLTKSHEHVGNWHGVTVSIKQEKYLYNNETFSIVDLPGIYSLTPLSFEEEVAVNYLYSHKNDIIINIVDINNLHRNLFLTLELIEMGLNVILLVNKTSKKSCVNIKSLEKLQTKVILVDAQNAKEEINLKKQISIFANQKFIKNNEKLIKYNEKIKKNNQKVQNLINFNQLSLKFNKDYLSLKCLENDIFIINKLNLSMQQKDALEKIQKEICIDEIIKNRYENIENILEVKSYKKVAYGKSKIDKIVLNKYLCLPIFLIVLVAIFYLTFFSIGAVCSETLSSFVQNIFGKWLLEMVESVTLNPIVIDFFESAIIGGLGSIFSFLPQVVVLFICLGILEDSGYLARVAFSLDDIFSKVGLSGKSVYTLLMGFGCSTTACLTARTMDSKNSKIKTAMLAPYMSCSAKLPIYAVIGSAFFGASNVFVILGMYMLGVLVALLLSVFYEKTFLKSHEQSFILEFPPYRAISLRKLISIFFQNSKQFIIRVGSLLLSVNIIVWVLTNFSFGFSFIKLSGEKSMIESLGRIIAPIFAPLGFNSWGASSALIAGLVAKEIIVSTIALINNVDSFKISETLRNPLSPISFTPASALSFMVFCLLYSPCLATVAVLNKEIGKKWTFISIVVQFLLAYLISLIIFTSVNLILNKGIAVFLVTVFIIAIMVFAVRCLYKYFCKKRCSFCGRCKRK